MHPAHRFPCARKKETKLDSPAGSAQKAIRRQPSWVTLRPAECQDWPVANPTCRSWKPARERTAARMEAEKITKVLKDGQSREQDALLPLAQQRIVLAAIPGLAEKEY